jgi:hypothetical protein
MSTDRKEKLLDLNALLMHYIKSLNGIEAAVTGLEQYTTSEVHTEGVGVLVQDLRERLEELHSDFAGAITGAGDAP